MDKLLDVIYGDQSNWEQKNREAFESLFGAGGRYPDRARSSAKLRAPIFGSGGGVSFAAYIHPSNPDSGAYGGLSFVIFPTDNGSCLISLVVGTQGIAPDENVLGKPGHARKAKAICTWLNRRFGHGELLAWSKADPVRIDVDVPKQIRQQFSAFQSVFERYGRVIYALYSPNEDRIATRSALSAFLDLVFEERGFYTLSSFKSEADRIRSQYFSCVMPSVDGEEVKHLLIDRRYVILEGPPGTGKTRLAMHLLKDEYKGNGVSIQFHPNVTYENFVGGLAPIVSEDQIGFRFAPKRGFLMEAAIAAEQNPGQAYLLHIDEINRADLTKILGEAIFLFEAQSDLKRVSRLSYDFGSPTYDRLTLPDNLHIIGTMNSSDRSIAIMDVAIRRRFAFLKLWPQLSVVEANASPLMLEAFKSLLSIFVEHASDEALRLLPGHAYFLETESSKSVRSLQTNVAPLLEEYLEQGYVVGFSEHIRAYLQWIDSL